MALTQTQVSQLYVAIFNRASEGAGNTYWQTNASDMASCANYMLSTPDAQTYFGTSLNTNQAFIEHIYLNTLNKSATDDPAGIAYWKGLLDNGMSRGAVVAALVTAVGDYASSTDPATINAYNQFNNRVTVSNYMANTVSAAPTDYATSTSFSSGLPVTYNSSTVTSAQLKVGDLATPTYTIAAGATSVTEGSGVTLTVTSSVAQSTDRTMDYQITGVAVAGGTATPASDLGQVTGTVTIAAGQTTGTFTLTPIDDATTEGFEGFNVSLLNSSFTTVATSSNIVIKDGASAGQTFTLTTGFDAITGTSGNDTINGTDTTFLAGDNVAGGSGTDTLNLVLGGSPATAAVISSGVENVTAQAAAAATLNAANWTGVTTLTNNLSTAALTVNNLQNKVDLSLTKSGHDLTTGFAAAVVAGTTDTLNVAINGATTGTITTGGGFETIAVTTSGAASSITNIVDASASTLTVAGDQALTITGGLQAATTTVNASTMTGALTVTLGAAATATVTGGAGNDSLTVSAVTGNVTVNAGKGDDTVVAALNLAVTDTLAGGDGTDTLSTTYALANAYAAPATATITGFEALTLTTALAGAVTAGNFGSDVKTVTVAGGTGTLTLLAGTNTVNLSAALAGGALTLNDTGTATTDAVTLANKGAATDTGAGQALTIGGFETTTINGTGTGAATTQTFGAIGITPDTGGNATLNIAGSNTVTVGAITVTNTGAAKIDASGLTGSASFLNTGLTAGTSSSTTIIGSANGDTLVGAATATSIDGGAGNDTITGGAGNDSITGGAGNDAITTAAGDDSVSGGDGNDTITTAGNLTAADTIDGGAGTDILTVSAATLDAAFTKVTLVENVTQLGAAAVTVGALAQAAGVTTLTDTAASAQVFNIGAGFTNALAVNIDGGDSDNVAAAAYTGALTVTTITALVAGDTITGGTGTSDALVFSLAGGSITQAAATIANVSAIERISTTGSTTNNLSLTLGDVNTAATKTLTIDGSALTTGVLTVDATLEADGYIVVTGGGAADAFTVSASAAGGDNFTGGAGADVITVSTTANLTAADTLAGGTGVDIINFTQAAGNAVTDAMFTKATSLENVVLTTDTTGQSVTLGTLAVAAGVVSVSAAAVTTNTKTVTIDLSGMVGSTGVSITGGAGADTILGSSGNDTIAGGTNGAVADIITGGAGADSITIGALTTGKVKINLNADVAAGTTLANADQITGLTTTVNTLDLSGTTLMSTGGTVLALTNGTDAGLAGAGVAYISGAAASMANLAAVANQQGLVFEVSNDAVVGTTNAVANTLLNQAGIDEAVTFITTNIGTATVQNTNVFLVVNDGTNSAIFNYQEGALDQGIQSSELMLVGVLVGNNGVAGLASGDLV